MNEQQAREFGAGEAKVRIDSELLVRPEQSETVLGVRKALEQLRKVSPREARVLQLQFYGGLTQEEIAAVLGVSLETVKLDARKAKAFVKTHLASPSRDCHLRQRQSLKIRRTIFRFLESSEVRFRCSIGSRQSRRLAGRRYLQSSESLPSKS